MNFKDAFLLRKQLFTVFAPSNEAFESDEYYPGMSREDKVRAHVGLGVVKAGRIADGDRMETLLEGSPVEFAVEKDRDGFVVVRANGHVMILGAEEAANGVVHTIVNKDFDYYEYDRYNY